MFGGMCCEEAEGIGSGFGIVGFDDGEEFGGVGADAVGAGGGAGGFGDVCVGVVEEGGKGLGDGGGDGAGADFGEGTVAAFDRVEDGWVGPGVEDVEGDEAEVLGGGVASCEFGDAGGLFGGAETEGGGEGAAESAFVVGGGIEELSEGVSGGGDGGVVVDGAGGFGDEERVWIG